MILDILLLIVLITFLVQSLFFLSYFKSVNRFFQQIEKIELPEKVKK